MLMSKNRVTETTFLPLEPLTWEGPIGPSWEPEPQTRRERALAVTRKARLFLADPAHWCKGSSAEDANGNMTNPTSRNAVRFCLAGSIYRGAYAYSDQTLYSEFPREWNKAMGDAGAIMDEIARIRANSSRVDGYVDYNDSYGTHADMVSLLAETEERLLTEQYAVYED